MKRTILTFLLLFQIFAGNGLSSDNGQTKSSDLSRTPAKASLIEEYARFLIEHMAPPEQTLVSERDLTENIKYAVKARNLMPWGRSVPESIFVNYVLPYRISQEPLTSWRPYFFANLAPEVINQKSMRDAALRILDWFYKRVRYKPSDPRDLDPISLLKRGWGRCEEINIAVIAGMRSVAIPARPVWVPAWSHTDGNHGWVEVYLDDGRWHFVDPSSCSNKLDSAWFSPYIPMAPVVLTHALQDNSCIIYRETSFDQICNITNRYSSTVDLTVIPELSSKREREEIIVSVNVANGGRLRPVLSARTLPGKPTRFSLTPGTYIVSAAAPPSPPAYTCTRVTSDTRVIIPLDHLDHFSCALPTVETSQNLPTATAPSTCSNDQPFDKIRRVISKWLGEPEDSKLVIQLASAGPSAYELLLAMENLKEDDKKLFKKLLLAAPSKELIQANPDLLIDYMGHIKNIADPTIPDPIFESFLLNPRIFDEPVDWRYRELSSMVRQDGGNLMQDSLKIQKLIEGIKIKKCALFSPPMTPWEVLQSGLACSSRDINITAVALFRSAGHPALYMDYGGVVAVYDKEVWHSFNSGNPKSPLSPLNLVKLTLEISGNGKGCADSPPLEYMRDFCLVRWTGRDFLPVRNRDAALIWNKHDCSYTLTILPGTYDLSFVRKTPQGRIISIFRLRLQKDEKLKLS